MIMKPINYLLLSGIFLVAGLYHESLALGALILSVAGIVRVWKDTKGTI